MTPEEGVRAHLDLQGGSAAGVLLPVHWGTFKLAPHLWAEPAEWMADVAGEAGQAVAFPRPGAPFEPAGGLPTDPWWRRLSRPVPATWTSPSRPRTWRSSGSGTPRRLS